MSLDRSDGPCVVTVYRNGSWPHTTAMRDVLSRRAFVTLDGDEGVWRWLATSRPEVTWASIEALKLTPPGLPMMVGQTDGTVIEVEALGERTGWIKLASTLPYSGDWVNMSHTEQGRRDLVDAYNAAELARATGEGTT